MPDDVNAAGSSPAETTGAVDPETTEQPVPETSAPSTPEPSAPAEGETAPESDPGAITERVSPKEPKETGAEKRIRQLNARLKQTEQRLRQYEQPPPGYQPPVLQPPPKPRFTDYADKGWDAWEAANAQYTQHYAEYAARKAVEDDRVQQAQLRHQADIRASNERMQHSWAKRQEATLKRNPNFDVQAAVHAVQPNQALDHYILHSRIGPDVLDYLAKHPEEAERFRELDAHETYVEAVHLEQKLAHEIQGLPPQRGLPPPPSYVKGAGTPPKKERFLENILYGD
jgi:hypothetical protein